MTNEDKGTKHFPAKPDKFEFDAEVAAVFPNMAARSIPNFYEAHNMHASMLRKHFAARRMVHMLDVGASRGAFADAVGLHWAEDSPAYRLTLMEHSKDMLSYLTRDYSQHQVEYVDLNKAAPAGGQGSYDVVVLNYVMQFVDPHVQARRLREVMDLVRPGGVFIMGHKESHEGPTGEAMHDEYIHFRMRHGYTREEIEAKTRALAGAMWPMSKFHFLKAAAEMGYQVFETTRYAMFATYYCVRG